MTLDRKLSITLAVVGVGWLIMLVAWRPAPFAVSYDDAYYYFTIGRNWAHGHASTFDMIDRTNGYHPLWQLLSVIPYLLGLNGTTAVRALLATQLVLWMGALTLMRRQIATAAAGWPTLADRPKARRLADAAVVVVFAVLAINPFLFKMVVNGLESGLVMPVGALLIWWSVKFGGRFVSRTNRSQRVTTGVILAVAFLSRTDAILLIGSVGAWCLLDGGTAKKPVAISTRIARTAEVLAGPALTIAAYLLINRTVFGTALQISGTIKRLPLTPTRVMVSCVWAAVGLGVMFFTRRTIPARSKARRTRRFLRETGFYGTFCIALVGYYSTLQAVPYLWYFAPLALYGVWFLMLFTVDLVEGSLAEAIAKDPARDISFAGVMPSMIIAVPLAIACVWSFGSFLDPGTRALMVHDAAAGAWIDKNLPPNARIASWDAGVIGYFSDRRVVNLDGVVNSERWQQSLEHGNTAPFLADRHVTFVANHGGDVAGGDPGIDGLIRHFFGTAATQTITVIYRDHYRYSGSLDGSRSNTSTKRMGTYVYRLEH